MSAKKRPQSGPKVPLTMSKAERKLILESLTYLDSEYAEGIRSTPMDEPVRFTLDNWEGLSGCIAAEANHTRNKVLGRKLERLLDRIDGLLESGDAPTTLKVYRGEEDQPPQDAVKLAEYAALMTSLIDHMCQVRHEDPQAVRSTRNLDLKLGQPERSAIITETPVSEEIKALLAQADRSPVHVSINDLASICFALSEAMTDQEKYDSLKAVAVAVIQRFTEAVHGTARLQGPPAGTKKHKPRKSPEEEGM